MWDRLHLSAGLTLDFSCVTGSSTGLDGKRGCRGSEYEHYNVTGCDEVDPSRNTPKFPVNIVPKRR